MRVPAYLLLFLVSAQSAYVPPDPWSVLTPTATWGHNIPALTDYSTPFALLVQTVGSMATSLKDIGKFSSGKNKNSGKALTTAWPGYTTCNLLNQVSDGQIQYPTKKSTGVKTIPHVTQVSDGQIQYPTKVSKPLKTASHATQIPDGQVQVHARENVVDQGGDGQIVEPTASKAQSTTKIPVITQISDGQVQIPVVTHQPICNGSVWETCVNKDSLVITLKKGVLYDEKGRIGAIVSNHQFQFDGPPPQAGTIYAKGWSLVPSESGLKLALGTQTIFYKCLSGDFYNLYDKWIALQCYAVEIQILKAIEC